MKSLTAILSLMLAAAVASPVQASYGLNDHWREIKERVTRPFAQEIKAAQEALKTQLEDDLGVALEVESSADGRWSSFVASGDRAAFSQCLPALNCGQYDCMQQQYQCADDSFLPNFPVKVCKSFEDNINLGSYDENGVLWVYETTYCLQKMAMIGLIDPARADSERCEVIEEQIVDRHEECFFDQKTSLCDLSFQNKKAVFTTLLPHGGRFVTKNNRLDWHRVKILWDHFSRCPLNSYFKENSQCTPPSPTSCETQECLQDFANSLNCLLSE